MIFEDQGQHAEKVTEQFQCATLGDYHDLNLLTDNPLKAWVGEKLRGLNAIENSEYLIDFNSCFSDVKLVNRNKRAKKRSVERVSDGEIE